jgi:NAD(P)-dependent dehydrogenase (short-subunit alcohol dehydrogenase family)
MSDGLSRTALVTGASSGIGAAIATAFGKLGWAVALGARRLDGLEQVAARVEAAGGRAFVQPLDVASAESIGAFYGASQAALGPFDVVVSNAGTCVPGLLHEVADEDLRLEVETNLLGPLWLARRAVESMRERDRGGDLVFIGSENAVAPRTFQVGYSATKAGLEVMARALAMELEGTGIRASVVRPGPTASEFGRNWPAEILQRMLRSWQYWGLQRNLAMIPAEAVADAVVGLVTRPAGEQFSLVQVTPEGPAGSNRAAIGDLADPTPGGGS